MHHRGFTIVELLIVVIVIAILATITIIAYNGIIGRSQESVVKSDLQEAITQLKLSHTNNGSYPANTDNIRKSDGVTFTAYNHDTNTFCLEAINNQLPDKPFHVTDSGLVENGVCPPHPIQDGDFIQTITDANCPTDRIRAVDARDNHTYWVQKLADGKCWMLTNLAYAGGTSNGGVSTYGDVISTSTLTNGTSNAKTYTDARYYVHTSANPTTEPTAPSTSTDGGVTNTQYGYLYNFCGANGGQTGNGACSNSSSVAVNTDISVCPSGWRLPTGNGGEFGALNTAVNGGLTNTDLGLRENWLEQRPGLWAGSGVFANANTAYYWSSTQYSVTISYYTFFISSQISAVEHSYNKNFGFAVRCLAI